MVKPGKKNGRHYTKIRYKVRHRDIHANLERSWLCNLKYFLYFCIFLPCLQLIVVKLNILRNYPDITETNTRKNIKILILMILISFYVRER